MRTFTPPSLEAFTHCPRKYEYAYLWKLAPIVYNSSALLGRGLHAGVAQLQCGPRANGSDGAIVRARAAMKDDLLKLKKLMDQDEFEEVLERAKRDHAKVCAMLRAYQVVYPGQLPMAQVECRYTPRPIVNPITGKDSRTFQLAGVFDGYYRLEDRRVMLYQVKSTSESLREARAILAQSIQPNLLMSMFPQVEGAQLAGICIDIVKKPVAPFRRTKIKRRKGESEKSWAARLEEEARREPLKDYEERCYKAYVADPPRFFQRLHLPVDPNRIRDAQAVAWRIAREVRESDRHGYLACRGANCRNSQGWCDYRDLCWYQNCQNYRHCEYAHDELELAS